MRKFILNADDFGKSESHNIAVVNAASHGLLKSASLMTTMPYFNHAVDKIKFLPQGFRVGVHLNLVEGRAINPNFKTLTNRFGCFNNNFLMLLIKSYSKDFLDEVEKELESQIKLALVYFQPTHLDSHMHVHSIPNIFKIVLKLAKKYNIPYVRTQKEIPCFVKGTNFKKYFLNLAKVALLNSLNVINKKELLNSDIKTNDYLLGVAYTSMMTPKAIIEGLKRIKSENVTAEALLHPCVYSNNKKDCHTLEYETAINEWLLSAIKGLGFEV